MRNLTSTIELSNGSSLMNEDDNLIELDGLLQYIYSTKKVLDYNGLIHLSKSIEENYVDMTTLGAVVDAMQIALDNIAVPTKTSDLVNDSIIIPTKTSDLVNDSIVVPTKTSDLINDSIVVPTKTSDLVNDSGFIHNMTIIDVSAAHSSSRYTNYTNNQYEEAPNSYISTNSNIGNTVGHYFNKGQVYYPGQPYTYYTSSGSQSGNIYAPGYIYTLEPLPDNVSTYDEYKSYLVLWTTKTQILNKGGTYSQKTSTLQLYYINYSSSLAIQKGVQYYCYFVDLNTNDLNLIRPGQKDSRNCLFSYNPKLAILPTDAASNRYICQPFYAWGPYYYKISSGGWRSFGYDTIKKQALYPAILIESDRTTLIIDANTEYIIPNLQQITAGDVLNSRSLHLKDDYQYILKAKGIDTQNLALNNPIYIGLSEKAPSMYGTPSEPYPKSVTSNLYANTIGFNNVANLFSYASSDISALTSTVSGLGLVLKEGPSQGQFIIGKYNYVESKGYLSGMPYSYMTLEQLDALNKIEEWQPYKVYEPGTIVKQTNESNNTVNYYQAHTGGQVTSNYGYDPFDIISVPKYTYPTMNSYYWRVVYSSSSILTDDYYKTYSVTNAASNGSIQVNLIDAEEWSSEKTYHKEEIVKVRAEYYGNWDYITKEYGDYDKNTYIWFMCVQDECPPYVPLTCQQYWHTTSSSNQLYNYHLPLLHNHLFTIGNGTDMYYNRSNAFAVDTTGDAYLNKDLYVRCDAASKNGVKVATITELSTISDEVSTINNSITELDTTIYQLRRRIAALESEVASLKNSSNNATDSQLESETGSMITDENGNPIEFDLPASITPSTVVMEDGQPLYTESGNTLEYNQQGG